MEIRPGEGVGQIRFGLTEEELIRMLGPPDKRFHCPYCPDPEDLKLQYFALRLEFQIESNKEDRLGWIAVHTPNATLFGKRVIGEPIEVVLPLVLNGLCVEPEHEDYGSFETFFFAEHWVEIHVKFGCVEHVNCGVLYGEDDEPQWPG